MVHRRTTSTSHASVRHSLFESLDPLTDDVAVSLQQYPRREYSNTHSAAYCASLCQLNDTCNFFHFDQKGAICITYQLADGAVKENGLFCFPFLIFVICTCFLFDMNIFQLSLVYLSRRLKCRPPVHRSRPSSIFVNFSHFRLLL